MARISSACTSTARLRKFVRSVRIPTSGPAESKAPTGEVLWLLQGDYDFSSSVAFFQISDRRRDFTQLVSPIDDRFHLSGLHEIAQDSQVRVARVRHPHAPFLPDA